MKYVLALPFLGVAYLIGALLSEDVMWWAVLVVGVLICALFVLAYTVRTNPKMYAVIDIALFLTGCAVLLWLGNDIATEHISRSTTVPIPSR